MRHVFPTCLIVLLGLASVFGCGNPADDKPEALVGEAAPVPAADSGTRFLISEDSKIGFVGSKVTGSHSGGFKSFEGEIRVIDGDPERSSVQVTIDTTTLWADSERLTGHLRSPDFFEVETYPTATFSSTEIRKKDDQYRVTGNLELHGTTKSISFPASIRLEEDSLAVQAEFVIKRFDFGITYPGRADDLIRDEVVIQLDLTASPAAS